MKNGISTRGSKILVGAIALMIGASVAFAETLIPFVANTSSGNGGGNLLNVVDPDGTWIFTTNGTAAAWSVGTNWAGGIIADGGGFADFSTLNIPGGRNPDVDTTSRTVRRLDIGDTNGT